MTVSLEINGVFFRGKFDPTSEEAVLIGTGADLLHCVFHFDPRTHAGAGECLQSGLQRFDVTLAN